MERRGPSETSPGNFFSPFISESDFDSEVVPASLASIAPILCVANDIETRSPRAAFICRFYAFEKSRAMDTTSNGRGVRQFKTALLQRLEREAESTLQGRMEKSDAIEMKNIYKQYYENYVKSLDEAANQAARAHLEKEYQTTAVLFEVLKFVTESESVEVASEVMEAGKNPGAHQVIMQLPEIRAAVATVRNIHGLPWPEQHKKIGADLYLLDWLQAMFGSKGRKHEYCGGEGLQLFVSSASVGSF